MRWVLVREMVLYEDVSGGASVNRIAAVLPQEAAAVPLAAHDGRRAKWILEHGKRE
ncbi:hypothetical protein RALTA_B1399 [Cupriavidus taiwanensis LMG 19424]|uniref:Uncharacterized protein n=1 Tax=Cupriavidus taiwanensis (strain DSM 17343 / BCRC 17206 / CCUG 44338 / CIP 107171 / LMG 19424 / R1) TaxID=977880 RepID=B3RAS1_CUPTR|nr:hypothetical protein RALTA_B1399 [Cupriavidus taiwanensis LMG 19424]SPC15283.1 conserved hypothetical protein [Cupriavidus taiwanensis]